MSDETGDLHETVVLDDSTKHTEETTSVFTDKEHDHGSGSDVLVAGLKGEVREGEG